MVRLRSRGNRSTGVAVGKTVTMSQLKNVLRQHDLSSREIKKYTANNGGTTSSSGVVVPVTVNIAQGDNISDRAGDEIRMVRCDFHFEANMNFSAGAERIRFVCFIDKRNLGSTPAVTDVLNTASTIAFINTINDQSHRFTILCDKKMTLTIGGGYGQSMSHVQRFVRPKLVSFLGTTGVQGNGHVYVLIISDLGALNGAYNVSWNVRYTDA